METEVRRTWWNRQHWAVQLLVCLGAISLVMMIAYAALVAWLLTHWVDIG